jgi:hypothetical protein
MMTEFDIRFRRDQERERARVAIQISRGLCVEKNTGRTGPDNNFSCTKRALPGEERCGLHLKMRRGRS